MTQINLLSLIGFIALTLTPLNAFAARGPHDQTVTSNCLERAKQRREGYEMRFCIDCCNVNGGHHACIQQCHTTIGGNYSARGEDGSNSSKDETELYPEFFEAVPK